MSNGNKDYRPVLTIYDTETEYVTRQGFEKLLRRVEALERRADPHADPSPAPEEKQETGTPPAVSEDP
jgi:hypothetical protein